LQERNTNLSNSERRWLERACRLAAQSKENNKHGCIIVKSGNVMGVGVNTKRNQPGIIEEIDCLSVHAEINALRNAGNCSGGVAYIARVNSSGDKRQSKPCPSCLGALKLAGIKRVVYTIDGNEYI
jgi:tRNA(Arg) A34 adenosine deaminase TadA